MASFCVEFRLELSRLSKREISRDNFLWLQVFFLDVPQSLTWCVMGPNSSRSMGATRLRQTVGGLAWSHSRGSYRWDTISTISHTNKPTLATDHELTPAGFLNDLLNFLPILPKSHTLWKALHPDPVHTNITKIPGLKPSPGSQGCVGAGLHDCKRPELHEIVGNLSPMCSGQPGSL